MPAVNLAVQGNRLLVWTDPVEMEAIRRLIDTIDKESEQVRNEPRMQTFSFKAIETKVLEAALKILPVQMKYAVDAQNRQLIVTGDGKALAMVADLVKSLDRRPAEPSKRQEWQVRIVWLATGQKRGEGDAATPPADLKGVLAELARIGVENPRLVTQAVGNVSTGDASNIGGVAHLDVAYDLRIQSNLIIGSDGKPQLAININAEPQGTATNFGKLEPGTVIPPPPGKLQLEATITTPPGHAVVLGVTPSGLTTSIFIVQLLEKPLAAVPD